MVRDVSPAAGDVFGMTVDVADRGAVVNVRGELDVATAPALADCVARMLDQGRCHITIDLDEVEFLDSQGLHALVVGYKQARARGGDLVVRRPRGHVLKVLEMCGLTTVLSVGADAD